MWGWFILYILFGGWDRDIWTEPWCQSNLVRSTRCRGRVTLDDNCINHINIMGVRRQRGFYDNCINNGSRDTSKTVSWLLLMYVLYPAWWSTSQTLESFQTIVKCFVHVQNQAWRLYISKDVNVLRLKCKPALQRVLTPQFIVFGHNMVFTVWIRHFVSPESYTEEKCGYMVLHIIIYIILI